MDSGKGYFEQATATSEKDLENKLAQMSAKFPEHGGVFKQGEILEIKGSRFRIGTITPKKMVLRLLSKQGMDND